MKNYLLKLLTLPLVLIFNGCNIEEEQATSENFRLLNDQQLAYLSEIDADINDESLDSFIAEEKNRASKGSGQGICASIEDVEVLVMKIKENANISEETEQKLRDNLTKACQNKLDAQARSNKPDGVGAGKPDGVGGGKPNRADDEIPEAGEGAE